MQCVNVYLSYFYVSEMADVVQALLQKIDYTSDTTAGKLTSQESQKFDFFQGGVGGFVTNKQTP